VSAELGLLIVLLAAPLVLGSHTVTDGAGRAATPL
jgi:hypothetical protein